MHLLVTGVGGFVGSRLARLLLARGEQVSGTVFGAAGGAAVPPGVAAYEADLLDPAALARTVQAAGPDAVIHLAGLTHVGESWSREAEYVRVNVQGTENLLAAAAGRPVVVASSAEVYGVVPEAEQPIAEDRPLAPSSPYARTKAAAERLALAHGAVVVRSFNLVGAGQSKTYVLPGLAAQLARIARRRQESQEGQEAVLSVGNLEARRDFLHVDDGVEAYRLLATAGRAGEVYNLASGRAWSIREALDRLLAISGVAARIEIDPARLRANDLPLLLGDAGRLRALGWAPRHTFDEALAGLWAAAQEAERA